MTLGLLTDIAALIWACGVALLVLLVAATLVLVRRNRHLSQRVAGMQQVLDHYAKKLVDRQKSRPQMFSYARWDEAVTVLANGDGHLVREFEIVVGAEPLDAFWNRSSGFLAGADMGAAQEAVRVTARLTDDDGAGVELNVTKQWEAARLRAFVHFLADCTPGSRVRVRMEWTWPRLYENLLAGRTEPRTWFMQHDTQELTANFTISKELVVRVPTVSAEPSYTEKPTRRQNADGSITFVLTKSGITAGEKFGYLVQLREQ